MHGDFRTIGLIFARKSAIFIDIHFKLFVIQFNSQHICKCLFSMYIFIKCLHINLIESASTSFILIQVNLAFSYVLWRIHNESETLYRT